MNKFITKVARIFLGLSMAAGVGVAIGTSKKSSVETSAKSNTVTWTATSGALGASCSSSAVGATATGTITDTGNHSWSYTRTVKAIEKSTSSTAASFQGNTWIQLGANACSQELVLTTGEIAGKVTSISVISATAGTHKLTVQVGSTKYLNAVTMATYSNNASATNPNPTGAGANNVKCELTGTGTTVASSTNKITITITPGSRKAMLIRGFSVTYVTDDEQTISGASSAFTDETVSLTSTAGNPTWSIVTASTTAAGAAVNSSGVVSVTGAGTVVVKASKSGYVDATHTIQFSVRPVVAFVTLSIESSEPYYKGQQISISASSGNLAGSGLEWSVESGSITSISSSNSSFTGTLASTGTVTVKAQDNGGDANDSVSISVSPLTISGLSASASVDLTGTLNLASGVSVQAGTIAWSSSNTTVATINSSGVLSALSVGQTTVTATASLDSTVSASCTVTVNPFSVGFESSEGFTASTTYNNDEPVLVGPTGNRWSVLCGSPTETSPRTGTQDMHIRYYSSIDETPYMEMTWDIPDAHELTFYAKGHDAQRTISVEYSTDSGSSWSTLIAEEACASIDYHLVTATIATWVAKARFRINLLSTADKKGVFIDDVAISTMAKSTDPVISITSKDGAGKMSGVIGNIQEVTYEAENDQGLTLVWVLSDSESIIDWEEPYIEFLKVGADATLTAQLKNGSNEVVASDSVTLSTLVPSLDLKVNGTSRATWSMYEEDDIVITVGESNKPSSAVTTIATNDTEMDYSIFDDSDGSFEAIGAGTVVVTATMQYNTSTIASDTLTITINALGEATLVVSTGTGKTNYIFGESLDTTGWTATYTDGKGASSDVLSSLDFGSLEFVGTKHLTATYEGTTSNPIDITVTNNGASVDSGTTSQNLETSTTTTNLNVNAEHVKSLSPSVNNVTSATVTLVCAFTGNANVSYTHEVTLKLYDSSDVELGSYAVSTTHQSSSNGTFEHTFTFSEPKTVAKASYTLTARQSGSNLRQRSFDVELTYGDATFAPKQALAWAQYFIDEVGELCDAGGNTSAQNVQAIKNKWTSLANEYGWMIDDSKDYFAEHTSNEKIARVLGMYSRIVVRYGQTNFIVDSQSNHVVNASNINPLNVLGTNTNTAIIIVIISLVSVSAIGGYFFLRKRKEQ